MRAPGWFWWGWLVPIPVMVATLAAFRSLAATLEIEPVLSGCGVGVLALLTLMLGIRLVFVATSARRCYLSRRRVLAGLPDVRARAVSSDVFPGMREAVPEESGTNRPRPLELTWGYPWGTRLAPGSYIGLFLGQLLQLWRMAAISTTIAHPSAVAGAALWRALPLDSGVLIIALLVVPPLVCMLISVLLTPSHTVTVRDIGLEVRSDHGRRRLVRWEDARFLEYGEVSTLDALARGQSDRYILYGSRGYVAWPADFLGNERPKGLAASEVHARLDAIRVQISWRSGLAPRKLDLADTQTQPQVP